MSSDSLYWPALICLAGGALTAIWAWGYHVGGKWSRHEAVGYQPEPWFWPALLITAAVICALGQTIIIAVEA